MSEFDILQTRACLGNARRILMKKCFILLVVFSVVVCLSAGVFAQNPRFLLTIEASDAAGVGGLNGGLADSLENIGPDTPLYISLYANGMRDFIGYEVRISLNHELYKGTIGFVANRPGPDVHPIAEANNFFSINGIKTPEAGSYYVMAGGVPPGTAGVSINDWAFLGRIALETRSSFSGYDMFTLLLASYVSSDGTKNDVSNFNTVYLNIVTTDIEDSDVSSGSPNSYTLGQNYPNPFNPTTTIPFEVVSGGNAKISVYNVLGQEVAVIADTFFPVGQHTVTFDASNMSSGIYFYKLEMNGFIDMKRLILLR